MGQVHIIMLFLPVIYDFRYFLLQQIYRFEYKYSNHFFFKSRGVFDMLLLVYKIQSFLNVSNIVFCYIVSPGQKSSFISEIESYTLRHIFSQLIQFLRESISIKS